MNESRIGFVVYGLDRAPTGIGTYSRELLAALRRVGVDMHVLQAGGGVVMPGASKLPGAGLLPGLLTVGQVEIGWAARKRNLAMVHDPTGAAPLLFTKVPRIVTICDVFPYLRPDTSTRLDWLNHHYWLPRILPRVDAVITISQQSKTDIIKHLPVRPQSVAVTSLAANEQFKILPPNNVAWVLERHGVQAPYILYVGSIEPRKNLLRLLEAYAHLRDWSQEWFLVIVGAQNFWKSSPVVEKVEKLGLESCVIFTGYIHDEDLPAFYNGADLFVFPSLYEGFGLPVLESMACGTPVITSNISSLPEVAGDAALLVDPYDYVAIAETMQRVLSDSDLAMDLREKGLVRVRKYSWERTARETMVVYQKVLA